MSTEQGASGGDGPQPFRAPLLVPPVHRRPAHVPPAAAAAAPALPDPAAPLPPPVHAPVELHQHLYGYHPAFHGKPEGFLLGQGGFAKVILATAVGPPLELIARKVFNLETTPSLSQNPNEFTAHEFHHNWRKEVSFMKRAQEFRLHPCLVHMRGCDEGARCIDYTLMENGDLWAFFQGWFAGTMFYQYIGNDVIYWSIDLLEALKYMHEDLNLLHMDIKADNVFLDKHFNAVLADVGLARPMPIRIKHTCQVPYAPPEARANCPEHPPPYAPAHNQGHAIASSQSENYDTFSLGVMLFMIVAWQGTMHATIEKIDKIVYQDEDWTPRISLPPVFKSIINSMMRYNKLERPTPAHLLTSPFYLEYKGYAKNPRWGPYIKPYTDEMRQLRHQLNIKEARIAELDSLNNARAGAADRARTLEATVQELRAQIAGEQSQQENDAQKELKLLKGKYSRLESESTARISSLEQEVESFNAHEVELTLERNAKITAEGQRDTAIHEKDCMQTQLDESKRVLKLITADRDALGEELRKLEATETAEKAKDSGQGTSSRLQSSMSTSQVDIPKQVPACFNAHAMCIGLDVCMCVCENSKIAYNSNVTVLAEDCVCVI